MNTESDPIAPPDPSDNGPANPAPPTVSLIGRLFLVPLLIVAAIIGCAVLVVLLFGGIVSEPERSLNELVAVLERPTGNKTVGVMLARDKEVWQAAQELAGRLRKPDRELSEHELERIVTRLSALVRRDGERSAELVDGERQKLAFVMIALARVGAPEALPALVAQLQAPAAATRRDALIALSYYPEPLDLAGDIAAIARTLDDQAVEVRIVACPVVARVAGSAEGARIFAVEILAERLEDPEREVHWNAALALGNLGDRRCKPVLLEMLDRAFWEEISSRGAPGMETGRGAADEYPLSPGRINVYLKASMEAGARLLDSADAEIREALNRLAEDKDAGVSGVAMKLLEPSLGADG